MSRIYGEEIEISGDKVKEFFDSRAKNAPEGNPLGITMYREKEVVEKRDITERETILKHLKFDDKTTVLDIGCGVGRWAKSFEGKVKSYLGIDFSEELLKIAAEEYNSPECHFQTMSATDIKIENLITPPPFDIIVISGLLIYLNDQELLDLFEKINLMSKDGTVITVREPVSTLDHRLSLNEHFSDSLAQTYSAIYRTDNEMRAFFNHLIGFNIEASDYIFDNQLHGNQETRNRYYILKR